MSSGGYYIYPNKNATLEEKKNCGIVMPGKKKIVTSYVGHMFEIRHEVKPRDDCEKIIQNTLCSIEKRRDINFQSLMLGKT